jgi:hypothetical protein
MHIHESNLPASDWLYGLFIVSMRSTSEIIGICRGPRKTILRISFAILRNLRFGWTLEARDG